MRSIFEDMAIRSFPCIKLAMIKAASLGTDAAGIKLYRLTNAVNIGNLAEFFCQNSANSSELLLKLQYRAIS